MNRAFAYLLDLLRPIGWALFRGLAAMGASWYGGYPVYAAARRASLTPRARQTTTPVAVHDEAARGIAEIEEYLAAKSARAESSDRPDPHRNGPRNVPPDSAVR
jgi:hypothetical protein